MTESPVRYRVSGITAMFMVMTALIFDLLQFLFTLFVFTIPLAWLSSMFAAILFWLWFLILGISYTSGRKAGLKVLTALSAVIVELVPVVNALPGTLVGVIGVIAISRLEDMQKGRNVPHKPVQRTRPRS